MTNGLLVIENHQNKNQAKNLQKSKFHEKLVKLSIKKCLSSFQNQIAQRLIAVDLQKILVPPILKIMSSQMNFAHNFQVVSMLELDQLLII